MGAELKALKPMEQTDETAQYEVMWNALSAKATPELLSVLTHVYYKVLEYYEMTLQAMPLHILNRNFNKRWAAELAKLDLPAIPLSRVLVAAQVSKTLPIVMTLTDSGAYMILPEAATGTYLGVLNRDIELEPENREHLNEITDVLKGKAAGPRLRGKGLKIAHTPFD